MKKLLCMILALVMVFSLAACGGSKKPADEIEDDVIIEAEPEAETEAPEEEQPAEEPGEENAETPDAPADEKPAEKPTQKPAQTPKPTQKPENAPTATPSPEVKPEVKPEEKPADPPAQEAPSAGDTAGDTLAAVWRANSQKSAEEIANAVITHSSIQFPGGVVPVEEGFLAGFDNTEIKGFSNGFMFGPMMGTIPFVGYVFELSAGTDADAFVSTLKANANPRWNICTEAEQTIVEKSGNKVFFLMCKKSFGE